VVDSKQNTTNKLVPYTQYSEDILKHKTSLETRTCLTTLATTRHNFEDITQTEFGDATCSVVLRQVTLKCIAPNLLGTQGKERKVVTPVLQLRHIGRLYCRVNKLCARTTHGT
jgi:hypothetical protein